MVERQTPAADDQTTGAREILTRAAGSPGKHFDLCRFLRQGPSRGGDVDRITLTAQTDHNLPTVFHDRFRLSCGIEVRKGNGFFCHGGPYTSTRVTFAGCGGKGRAEVIPWCFTIGSASVSAKVKILCNIDGCQKYAGGLPGRPPGIPAPSSSSAACLERCQPLWPHNSKGL
jgi:hypothetical protein